MRKILTIVLLSLFASLMQAQITIGGNVYGGGNAGDTEGSTKVTVYAGDLNEVYGGARMANVKGNAFVNIDGENASEYILINKVYGGNDISGSISGASSPVPEELTEDTKNGINNTWNAFVRISTKTETVDGKVRETDDAKKIYIGQLFGGGNGNYTYDSETDGNVVTHILKDAETGSEILRTAADIHQPGLGKTYLEILGGSIVNAFGGGNMATVTDDVVIHLDNPSKVVNHIKVKDGIEDDVNGTDLLTEDRFKLMGINYKFTYPNSDAFQIGNLFGGNNKVDMAIQPRWNLLGGKVRNLYSGGNEGRMTCPQGLLLVIPENSTLTVDNVYGGCRKADVRPLDAVGNDVPNAQIQLAENPTGIPAGFSARTRILGGNINNVYGGNDISGNVYGGNTVAILTTIHGSVYGGGNGSYAYTDNPALKNELLWRDFYYNPKDILGLSGDTFTELQSAEALNKVRPNAEQVSLLLRGKEDKPVFVEGSVFVGGNSASLAELTEIPNRQAHVKIGSYVTIDSLFLGNNGANMVKYNEEVRNEDGLVQTEGVLRTFANTTIAGGKKFNSMDLTKLDVFDKYMEGCAMKLLPSVVFDDVEGYVPYSSQFGSFYCGGNVGSILTNGLTEISFNEKAIIYEKFVGGCNRANVDATEFNAAYYGGLLGDPDSNGDKLKLNFSHLKIQPMRWKDPTDKLKGLEWNTVVYNPTTQQFDKVANVAPTDAGQSIASTDADIVRRLKGGNIYGGCYESGHVNGNVILNINETLMERDKLFDLTDEGDILYENTEKGKYTITKRNTGVILSEQGMDVLGDALNVFGAGYGAASEIWGSTTINLNKGYVFQIFGGGEMGAIGKKDADGMYGIKKADGTYGPDERYSTYINLNGAANLPGVARGAAGDSEDMAECEFIYGGAFEGVIAGSTHINLNNGRIFNSFAGSCNANILGHTETYVGSNGFPWICDHIYGGNDLGGRIEGYADFSGRIRSEVAGMVKPEYKEKVSKATTYMEYTQGRVRNILGGCFGDYDYNDPAYKVGTGDDCRVAEKPYLHNAFVNIRPNKKDNNEIAKVFGAGEGYLGDRDGDKGQDHSYVLIDIPDDIDNFANMEIFGAGAYNGLGMRYSAEETFRDGKDGGEAFDLNEASAIIDLMRGKVNAAYGGSFEEGITRRTVVNVPVKSTIKINNIFGGAYGMHILPPCDVYESNVNYRSGDARVNGAIYGGNNNVRRTLYAKVNISAPVLKANNYTGKIFGAGRGDYTWAEYTEVNLEEGANVYEVYGGGEMGNVLNAESVQKYLQLYSAQPAEMVANEDEYWGASDKWEGGIVGGTLKNAYKDEWLEVWKDAWTIGDYYAPIGEFKRYAYNEEKPYQYTNLQNPLVQEREIDDRDLSHLTAEQKARFYKRYNTNVIVNKGATVGGYVYGGGYGSASNPLTGGVYGSTYVAVLGGTVEKDVYASGTTGDVCDIFGVGAPSEDNPAGFIATANAYIKGGTVRNVYGGGWEGNTGYHNGKISDVANNVTDRDGEAHLVVGVAGDDNFFTGAPAITRNVYGGGEGGSVFGTAYIKMNNGYIGYRYKNVAAEGATANYQYVEELDDNGNDISEGGNIFGGGYVANSYTDASDIAMYGGTVRGCLYGGGEIGPIGRGSANSDASIAPAPSGTIINAAAKIYKGGSTSVTLYDGRVLRDVFGGGRGFDNWGGNGTKYMKPEVVAVTDFSSKGYVFGSTAVYIRGGEVGTEEGVMDDYGNVFAGGNEGFVFSAIGKKMGTKVSDDELVDGIPTNGGGYYYKDGVIANGLTRDCSAVIEPYCKVIAAGGITIDGTRYAQGDYVSVEALNKLGNKERSSADWAKVFRGDNTDGIVIHNAVFAGGNVREGSDNVVADTYTIFGNASVSVRDVYNRDLITIGTDDIGGVYGDGNLTFVDGFRELHIDNYGTDYYNLDPTMDYEAYQKLTEREKAYYQLRYVTKNTHVYNYYESRQLHTDSDTDISYRKGQKITEAAYNALSADEKVYWSAGSKVYQAEDQIEEGDYTLMDDVEKTNWELGGVCSRYAGRPMNTIQRADMCAVFGSRLVLKGAEDRVKAEDYNSYTINRVDELSLNRRESEAGDSGDNAVHGNYFGIYSSVNYLGNLTSDVFFTETFDPNDHSHSAIRQTDQANGGVEADGKTTYYQWKANDPQSKYRNNGISQNKVALASGVYLEIKREEGEALGEDKWGYVTGVIELDLINVMPGMGGGYVYAKNEHGVKQWHPEYGKVTILHENLTARTYRRFTYAESDLQVIETSGNFVHNTKQIVDDCYPNGGIYNDGYVKSPAHYWFIKGSIYVYDQYISAYTGTANAYAEKVELPLTISAASNGRMTLREVQPNYYAYYDKNGRKMDDEDADDHFEVNNISYKLNDPISYWDYRVLSEADQSKFVEETYVTIAECKIGDKTYPEGYVMLPDEYRRLKNNAPKKQIDGEGSEAVPSVYHVEQEEDVAFDFVFRPSNNMSHETGYVLTYDINNPMVWNNYYTLTNNPSQANRLNTEQYEASTNQGQYTEGPTFTPKAGKAGVYGQREYKTGEVVFGNVYTTYQNEVAGRLTDTSDQAKVEPAYIVTSEAVVNDANGDEIQHLYPGSPVYKSRYTDAQWTALKEHVEAAQVCTNLLEFSTADYVYAGQLLSSDDIAELKTKLRSMNAGWSDADAATFLKDYLSDAYYCTEGGLYGGEYFEAGKAYRALDTFCSMSKSDRDNFDFNYDAFDVLVDPTFSNRLESNYGNKPQYDGTNNPKIYSVSQPIDYQAEYRGAEVTYRDENGTSHTITPASDPEHWLSRTAYEDIPNERHHYSPIAVKEPGDYYVINKAFMRGDIPYTTGQVIDEELYLSMTAAQKENVDVLYFDESRTQKVDDEYIATNYYYCRDAYTVNEKGEGQPVTTLGIKPGTTSTTYTNGQEVPQGVIISETNLNTLCNFQQGFVIHGTSPTEISTLYVSSESDIYNLSTEKIITVIYLYEYEESDASGLNVTPVSERHIVNIHVKFKSGVPEIGKLNKPSVVLPGTTVALMTPTVSQGAFRVTDSGWEIFTNQNDADTHTNGQPFYNNVTPLYWYQNNYYLAYYAQTYLGKTYSNSVQFTVANYHDLAKVMADKENHYFIDHKDVDREPKIYINDYSGDDNAENGLDLFKNLIDLTYVESSDGGTISGGALDGHKPLDLTHKNQPMKGGEYLEFILNSDLNRESTAGNPWTPIASNDGECFMGTLHGDGHTVSGLDNSLIHKLCGNVYNLGVTGSFTTAGVADTGEGYVANSWVKTTGTPADGVKAVFGDPNALDGSAQVFNCYYSEANGYAAGDGLTAMPEKSFYNGEVAYNLNSYYLNKRYYDHNTSDMGAEPQTYSYFVDGTDEEGNAVLVKKEGQYGTDYSRFAYVEDRYADGDFFYADGTIPDTPNIRQYDEGPESHYYPVWPDDYIFFGQVLNYGHGTDYDHQDIPSSINKSDTRIQTSEGGNRVYRAPAYFRNNKMQVAYYNPYAVFAQTKKGDASTIAYQNMTAIDFTGYNDVSNGYKKGVVENADGTKHFFPPLLDDDGLTGFHNVDLTQNLLAYAPEVTVNEATHNVLDNYFSDLVCEEEADDEKTDADESNYRRIAAVNKADEQGVKGHVIFKSGNSYIADRDHYLVDKQDFNAPISYTFDGDNRMWYQRYPDNYVDERKGWEAVSLPFSAELVTTPDKGEITHFYNGSPTGHEYWLREFKGGSVASNDNKTFVAVFEKPESGTGKKDYTNTFLWDYYYSYDSYLDKNTDEYQKTYYQDEHIYTGYAFSAPATPYIAGFPGSRYYEFDLSGQFVPKYTHRNDIEALNTQPIIFASDYGATIEVSDKELQPVVANGYRFMPSYLNTTLDEAGMGYVLAADGGSFDKNAAGDVALAFRPYFMKSTNNSRGSDGIERIIFGNSSTTDLFAISGNPKLGVNGTLNIYGRKQYVIVESSLNYTTDVRIVTPAGITVASFTIKPGQTVEVRADFSGMYVVHTLDGKYMKKVAIKRG